MTSSNYGASLARVLAHEGGYTDHPDDPGGPTNFGITIADYRRYVKPDANAAEVKAMSIDDAKAIYRSKYWDALHCDALPAGLDYAIFDYGVNSGIARAAKVLQRALGIAADGVIGPVTLARVARSVASTLIMAVCDERLRFLQSLHTWPVFGKGWGRRVAEVRRAALAMAAQQGG
jgi:lysozyme family protein